MNIKKRNTKYSNDTLVEHILNCNINYNSLAQYGKHLSQIGGYPKYFHKYLNEIYVKWSKSNVFNIAYKNMLNDNFVEDTSNKLLLNTDTPYISNMYGIENVGVNPEYIKKT